jgi:peptide/nickel transport system substrate-binding protein
LRESIFSIAVSCLLTIAVPAPSQAEVTLRVVPHSDLKILDPIWTPAYITRNHGYISAQTICINRLTIRVCGVRSGLR